MGSNFVELREICKKITKGTTPTTLGGKFSEEGINFIKSESLNYDGSIDTTKFVKIDITTHAWLKRSQIETNDILYSIAGVNLGKCGSAKAEHLPANTNQAVAIIRIDPQKAVPKYIEYYLRNLSFVSAVNSSVAQSAQPNVNLTEIGNFKINLPSIGQQKDIVSILSILDEKIALNQRINKTLEAIAQALFKSWFVDFDPVKFKAEGRKPEGMDDAIASLFPSAFIESTLGPIPEGWEISFLGDFIELAYGKALKANGRNEGFVPVYGSNGQIGWHDTALVKGPGIVVGRKGNPGTIIYVHEDFFPIDTTFFVIPSQRVPSIIFLQMLMERLSLPSLSADSAVPGLNRNAAYSARCILPPSNLIENFNKLITPFILKKEILKNENKRLIDIRDLLLPRLISGKLRTKDDTP